GGTTHPTGGSWAVITGRAGAVPAITRAEREQLHQLFRSLDQMPEPGRLDPFDTPARFAPGDGLSPGDDFAARTSWADILEPHGWTMAYQRGAIGYWRRPGKQSPGICATVNALGTDRFRNFCSAAHPFNETSYSKLGAYAVLNHRGDHSAA